MPDLMKGVGWRGTSQDVYEYLYMDAAPPGCGRTAQGLLGIASRIVAVAKLLGATYPAIDASSGYREKADKRLGYSSVWVRWANSCLLLSRAVC